MSILEKRICDSGFFCRFCFVCFALLSLGSGQRAQGQLVERLFTVDRRIDSLDKKRLSFEADNLSFFKNNEFGSTVQKGYTLPGFWLQLKAVYYPFANLKLEAGVHSIWFWGTLRYPAFAYKGLSTWYGRDYTRHVHLLPYYRAHLALSENVSVVLGNIYGESNHQLIEPLYNPELNLTSDPEHGLQLLYRTKWLDFDAWVDWMTYIYKLDTHQESFIAGASARLKANDPDARFHVYFPVQGLAQHKGGEIDVSEANVQTVMNGALGAGLRWNRKDRTLTYINLECDAVGYTFQKGDTFVPKSGRGLFMRLDLQLKNFHINGSYWYGRDFTPILGSPFYGSYSVKTEGMMYFRNPQMLHLGADYTYSLGKGYAFGVQAEVYYYLSGKRIALDTGQIQDDAFGNNTNFGLGVYLRVNPSFLIKQF
jgi:hypothetical protein